jgi:hypothetical protein
MNWLISHRALSRSMSISSPANCEVPSVLWFLNVENIRPAESRHQIVEVYGEGDMNEGIERNSVVHLMRRRSDVRSKAWSDTRLSLSRVWKTGIMITVVKTGKIWGSHGGDYDKCRLLGYKHPVRTSQETNYVSSTEPIRLMLCKIWDFYGGDYEECRLLGYKNPVRTSQETHYVSATEPSQLLLCKIWCFHGGDYEECRLLGYKT